MKDNYKNEKSDYLYHYTSFSTAVKLIIPELKLKAGTFINSNDPREIESFGFGTLSNEAPNYKYLDDYEKEQLLISERLRKSVKYLCFCQDYFFENEWWDGYNMPRMWHQYAENHKGVCLEIDKELFIQENENLFSKSNVFFEDIEYSNSHEELTVNLILLRSDQEKYIQEFITDHNKYLFFRKTSDWSNENEKRILIIEADNDFYFNIHKSLKRIIVGIKFSEEELKQLVNTTRGLKVAKVEFNDERLRAFTFVDEYLEKLKSSSS